MPAREFLWWEPLSVGSVALYFVLVLLGGFLVMEVSCIFSLWQYYYTETDKHLLSKSKVADFNSMPVVILKDISLQILVSSFVLPTSIW